MSMQRAACLALVLFLLTPLIDSKLTVHDRASQAVLTGQIGTGLLNPVSCGASNAPSWCSGSDLGAWINAAFTACGLNCTVAIPPGNYSYDTTISMSTPSQSLVGAGSLSTVLHYRGSGDGILWQMKPFTVQKAGALRGLSIVGTSAAKNCVHSGSLQGSTWEDVTVSGCTGKGSTGILLENARIGRARAWTERTYMHNVHLGYTSEGGIPGNTNGLVFRVNGGTFSFGYSDFDVWFNVESNQIGTLVDTSAQLYHSNISLKGNMDRGPASMLTVRGDLFESTLNMFAETNLGSSPDAIHVTSKGHVNVQGNAQVWYGPGAGGLAVPLVDPGGFYVVEPWVAFDYPAVSSALSPYQRPMMETGYRSINSDGVIVVAQPQSGDLGGRLILTWGAKNDRSATMIMDVACSEHESVVCSLNVPVDYAYQGQSVFTNPTIKLTSGSSKVPQIQVTIRNRNGVSQNVTASWFGSTGNTDGGGGPMLFPATPLGTTSVRLVGLTSDGAGNLTVGQAIVGSIKTAGAAPTCSFTSGGGKSPVCSLDSGSTNAAGTIIARTGTGSPSGTGTITLSFNSSPFGTNKPVCQYQASDGGAGAWNGWVMMKDKTSSPLSDLFTWTNGTTPTALSPGTAYWINYQCWAK
ncbi:MAG TPA: hypothetical protein VGG14_18200 [Candidatus Sulfotelmatobacter sp.]